MKPLDNMKRLTKTFSFTPEFLEILDRVRIATKHTSNTATIIQAVMALDQKLNPLYKGAMLNRVLSPEEKAERQIKIEEAKESSKLEKLLAIVEALEGTVYEEGGEQRVQYYNYDGNYRDLQDVPLEMVHEGLVTEQYVPNKEDILRRRAEGKTKY